MIRTLEATRFVVPLREGSSLPAIVEADDGQLYVMKFSGAGQGRKALIAELVAGEIALALGLRVPELAFIRLDPALGPSEPDPELFDLLTASVGINFGLRYLPNAFAFNPLQSPLPEEELASTIVWLDAYVTNVDRTPRNVNILLWNRDLWLIDHGACLYFHHNWKTAADASRSPFPQIKDHTLLPFAAQLQNADNAAREKLTTDTIKNIVDSIPDAWLDGEPQFADHAAHRQAYFSFLTDRLQESKIFVAEAQHARSLRI